MSPLASTKSAARNTGEPPVPLPPPPRRALDAAAAVAQPVALIPRKLRELIADLKRAGFAQRPGKGSHRRFVHPKYPAGLTLSGHSEGADAKGYQEKQVREAIQQTQTIR